MPSGSVASCTKDTDHLKQFSLTQSGNAITVKGDLDEDIDTFTLDLDLTIQKFFLKKELKMKLPITLSPSIPKGPFTIGIGPADILLSPDPSVKVAGSVVMADPETEEVFCLKVEMVAEGSDIIV